jgi:hypothetical protein
MAAVNEWQEDDVLKETLVKLVEKSLKRTEILSFVERMTFPIILGVCVRWIDGFVILIYIIKIEMLQWQR